MFDKDTLSLSAQLRIDQRCDAFEKAWKQHSDDGGVGSPPPDLRAALGDITGAEGRVLFRELLDADLHYRWKACQHPRRQAYEHNFPEFKDVIAGMFQLGRYEIVGLLGRGAFGTVYRGNDTVLEREVAIKVPRAGRVSQPEDIERYLNEAKILAGFDHDNIVRVYDFGRTADGNCYVVYQLIQGTTLHDKMSAGIPTQSDTIALMITLAEALSHVHQQQLVHRDIKPANILIDSKGKPILADFGLALREVEVGNERDHGMTPQYASPEQAGGASVDGQSDIFSLGIIFYELLTGKHPFPGKDALQRIATVPARPLRLLQPSIPPELDQICRKALKIDLNERYCTATDLAHDLRLFKERSHAEIGKKVAVVTNSRGSQAGQSSVDAKRLFLSYRQGDAADEQLARFLALELEAAGHECFIDERLSVGTDWVQEINRRLRWCDCLIVLLSEDSMHSEMVQTEVRIAYELYRQAGRPRILPVRVGYFGPLDYELDLYIGRLQYIRWDGANDSARVAQELQLAIISNDILSHDSPPAARLTTASRAQPQSRPTAIADTRSAVAPTGTILAQNQFYIRRAEDQVAVECAAEIGVTLVVKGARQMGKSSLLMHYLSECQNAGKRIAFVDMSIFSSDDFCSYPIFLSRFADVLLHRLGLDRSLATRIDSQFAMIDFVESTLLPAISAPLVIALDEADRVLGKPFQADFFSMLRAWHNNRSMFLAPQWERLDLAMAISTEPYLLIEEGDRSPFNVGRILEVLPFTLAQCQDLNARYPGVLSASQVEQLWDLLGGHPYLTRLAYYRLTSADKVEFNRLISEAAADRGPFGDHLRALLVKLHERPKLLSALKEIIRTGTTHDHNLYFRLYGAGLVRRDGDRVNPSNLLYARYFRSAL